MENCVQHDCSHLYLGDDVPIKMDKQRISEISKKAVERWIDELERNVWRSVDLGVVLDEKVKLSNHSKKLERWASEQVLGQGMSRQLTRAQKDRLRDEIELHGRRVIEQFILLREPWVMQLAKMLRKSKGAKNGKSRSN